MKPDSSIITIDEIENHLSTPNVKEIISEIKNNNQVIFSSHRLESKINDIKAITFLGENEVDVAGAISSLEIEVKKYNKIILVEGIRDIHYIEKYIEIKRNLESNFNAIVVEVKGAGRMLRVRQELIDAGIETRKIFLIKDGDQADERNENVNYLEKQKIEDYRPDWADILDECEGNEGRAKKLASMRMDFLNQNHELFLELDNMIFEQNQN